MIEIAKGFDNGEQNFKIASKVKYATKTIKEIRKIVEYKCKIYNEGCCYDMFLEIIEGFEKGLPNHKIAQLAGLREKGSTKYDTDLVRRLRKYWEQ